MKRRLSWNLTKACCLCGVSCWRARCGTWKWTTFAWRSRTCYKKSATTRRRRRRVLKNRQQALAPATMRLPPTTTSVTLPALVPAAVTVRVCVLRVTAFRLAAADGCPPFPDSPAVASKDPTPSWAAFAQAVSVPSDVRVQLLWVATLQLLEGEGLLQRLRALAEAHAALRSPTYDGFGPSHDVSLELEQLPEPNLSAMPLAELPAPPSADGGAGTSDGAGDDGDGADGGADSAKEIPAPDLHDVHSVLTATLTSASDAAVFARGALAWGSARNAVRLLWNALQCAWVPPHRFGKHTDPEAGLGGVAASREAAVADEDDAGAPESKEDGADGAGAGGDEVGDGDVDEEEAAAQPAVEPPLDWAPVWRSALVLLDALEAIGLQRLEQSFGAGVPEPEDPDHHEDGEDMSSHDEGSEGGSQVRLHRFPRIFGLHALLIACFVCAQNTNVEFGPGHGIGESVEALPVGLSPDDLVWIVQFLAYTSQVLVYAEQWTLLVDLSDRCVWVFFGTLCRCAPATFPHPAFVVCVRACVCAGVFQRSQLIPWTPGCAARSVGVHRHRAVVDVVCGGHSGGFAQANASPRAAHAAGHGGCRPGAGQRPCRPLGRRSGARPASAFGWLRRSAGVCAPVWLCACAVPVRVCACAFVRVPVCLCLCLCVRILFPPLLLT